jgi:hypothetical protein
MPSSLDRFILGIPLLYIKQYSYAWIPFIALWTWTPNISLIFLLIIVIGILAVCWQSAAWISNLRREHAPKDGKFYVDRPGVPWGRVVQNVAILIAGSSLVFLLPKGQFWLSLWQIFLIIAGFSLLQRDAYFFGARTTYIITAAGIGIHFIPGQIDYRLFLPFKEISRIERTQYQKDKGWDFFARTRDDTDGLLLTPKDIHGFTKHIEKLFIVPKDIEKFLEQLPYGFG